MNQLFVKKRARPNLLQHQRRLMSYFQHCSLFAIGATDKNLGPFIIERIMYVAYAFGDHLSKKEVYKELTKTAATHKASNTPHSIIFLV